MTTQKTQGKTSKTEQALAVGVVLSDCEGTMRNRLDYTHLAQELAVLDTVVTVVHCSDLGNAELCSAAVREAVAAGARCLVAGGPSRERYEEQLRLALKKNRINPALWWTVNICELCGLAYPDKPTATAKALARLTAAVHRVSHTEPVTVTLKKIQKNVIVIGAGIAGLQTAVTLAELGIPVTITHSGTVPGGEGAAVPEGFGYIGETAGEACDEVIRCVDRLVNTAQTNTLITIEPGMTLTAVEGELGDFTVRMAGMNGSRTLQTGAVVLAMGSSAEPIRYREQHYQSPRIVDIAGIVTMIRTRSSMSRVALVMDVAAEQDRMISAQVLSVAELLADRFAVHVTIYCKNIRVSATGLERLYRRARQAGVLIVKSDTPLIIEPGSRSVSVKGYDPVAGTNVSEDYDIVVMADRLPAGNGKGIFSPVGGLRRGPDGLMQYDDIWLLPSMTNRPGIYTVGAARGNSEYREALTDGMAAAAAIHELLGDGVLEIHDDAATVDDKKCVLCLTCLRVCPHGAIRIDQAAKAAAVSPVSCKRCGICVSECPAEALSLPGYSDEQVAVDIGTNPRVTVFACENSAIPAAEAAAGFEYSGDIELIRVPCAGRVDPRSILTALERGADHILVIGCHPESCKYLTGSSRAAGRAERITAMLEKAGIDGRRVHFRGIASVEPSRFVEYIHEACAPVS